MSKSVNRRIPNPHSPSSLPHATANLQLPTWKKVCYNRLVDSQGKILTGLMERRAVEAAFDALAQADAADEAARLAQRIADFGSAALPVLLARLNTEDPKVRGGLGLAAQRLERELVTPALKAVIRARNRSDQERVTALTLLDRFLHEPTDDDLLAAIQNPAGVARQSLRELIAAMDENPAAIVEYLTQLAAQPAETPGLLLQAVPGLMPHPHLVTLLRMFAQGEDARLAQQAIEILGRTRSADALLALIGLTASAPPERVTAADRGMRKLRLSGVQAAPEPAPTAWQALLSPVDGLGVQAIWLICRPPEAAPPTAVSVIVRDPDGILAATQAGGEVELPPVVPEGEILSVPQANARRPLLLVSASFEAGRQALDRAQKLHWASGQPLPLAYRYLNQLFWQYGPPTEEAETDPDLAAGLLARHGRTTAILLDHPAFADWFWQAPAVFEAAERLDARYTAAQRAATVAELARAAFGPADAASYQRRLRAMAHWLELARQPEVAALARTAAAQLAVGSPEEILFVRRLIGIGLDIAAINLRSSYDRRRAM